MKEEEEKTMKRKSTKKDEDSGIKVATVEISDARSDEGVTGSGFLEKLFSSLCDKFHLFTISLI